MALGKKVLAVHLRSRIMARIAVAWDSMLSVSLNWTSGPYKICVRVPGLEVDVAGQIIGKKTSVPSSNASRRWRHTDRHNRSR